VILHRRPTESRLELTSRAEEVVNDAEGIARDGSFHSERVFASEKPLGLLSNDQMPADILGENLVPDSQCHGARGDVPRIGLGPTPCTHLLKLKSRLLAEIAPVNKS
jgi:hypothetical protein